MVSTWKIKHRNNTTVQKRVAAFIVSEPLRLDDRLPFPYSNSGNIRLLSWAKNRYGDGWSQSIAHDHNPHAVDVSLRAPESRATYSVVYGCNPENVCKARALIQRDLEQMRTQDVSPAELQQAKALLLRQIPLGESSEESVAAGILGRALIGLPLDEPIQAAKRYAELDADQVKAVFAKYVRPDDFVQVVRGPTP